MVKEKVGRHVAVSYASQHSKPQKMSVYGDVLNSYKTEISSSGEISLPVIRVGSQFGDPSRGGTWYSVQRRAEDVSKYYAHPDNIESRNRPEYLGGKEIWHRQLYIKKPYLFAYRSGSTEGKQNIFIAEELFGVDSVKKLSKGINSPDSVISERAFARVEFEIANELRRRNFDALIIHYEYPLNRKMFLEVFFVGDN